MKLSDSRVIRIKEDLAEGKSIKAIAEAQGISRSCVSRIRNGHTHSDLRIAADRIPMSESLEKRRVWSREQCIEELQRIANEHPDQVITRNFFRVHGVCSESTWTKFFGVFSEFKRQAGIIPTSHAKALESAIAKHSSVDRKRSLNKEKSGLGGKYLKPNGKRFKTALIGSDFHDFDCDPFVRRLWVETARRLQPDKVVYAGDVFNLAEFGKYHVDPREWNPVGRIKWAHALFEDTREATPESEFEFIEGNHEFRLLCHLSEATPALQTILSDLHGWTVPKLLGLDEYEINYHSNSDLGAFNASNIKKEISKNFLVLWDSVLVHHFPEGFNFGIPGCNGHHHHHTVRRHYSIQYGCSEWHQLGCGHVQRASYCNGAKWNNGFMIAHVDTHDLSTVFEYVDIRDFAVIGGEYYARLESENWSHPVETS